MSTKLPTVTLVVPVRNEAAHIDACLTALTTQTYPADLLEVIVVDGRSTDDTAARVQRWIDRDRRIRLIENPDQTMTIGLNIGIEGSTSDLVGVISGHSIVGRDYVKRTVHALRRTGAWCVGCGIERQATAPIQRAIARATSSPLGVGDALHNYAREAGWIESVFPGMWPRWVFGRVGVFDPEMAYNEDNEFSYRIRKAGGRIWYEPSIVVRYVPRSSLRGVFTQYRRYARGRLSVFRKHRGGLRWRHFVPPAWLVWLLASGMVGFIWPAAWLLFFGSVVVYLLALALAAWRGRQPGDSPVLTIAAFVVIHLGYAVGMLQGAVDLIRLGKRQDPSPLPNGSGEDPAGRS